MEKKIKKMKEAGEVQTNEPWSPDNPNGNFAKLVKSMNGDFRRAMLGMPDAELKKYFGYDNKDVLKRVLFRDPSVKDNPQGLKPLPGMSQAMKTVKDRPTGPNGTQLIDKEAYLEPKNENVEIIKKRLLHKKIQEHFRKNPKAKEIIIKSNFGDFKTAWKVKKEGKEYRVIEINTIKEQFVLNEAPPVPPTGPTSPTSQTTPVGGQKPATGAVKFDLQQFATLDFSSKMEMLRSGMVPINADSITMAFADLIKPGAGKEVVALRDFIQQNQSKANPVAKAAVGSALGFLTNLSNQQRLMQAGHNPAIQSEADEKKK